MAGEKDDKAEVLRILSLLAPYFLSTLGTYLVWGSRQDISQSLFYKVPNHNPKGSVLKVLLTP